MLSANKNIQKLHEMAARNLLYAKKEEEGECTLIREQHLRFYQVGYSFIGQLTDSKVLKRVSAQRGYLYTLQKKY